MPLSALNIKVQMSILGAVARQGGDEREVFQEESRDPVRANIYPPTKQAFQVQNEN